MTPFDVLQKDVDDFIMLLNYYYSLSKYESKAPEAPSENKSKDARIRVNDKTASGGWW